ncbi:phosphoribosyl-AMP cyclohydrolase [bacterium]|nr:phosphoribosyl-AMP cyclohydrolase [bacterium]
MDISLVKFDDNGLVPAVAQDATTGEILMVAWANEEALRETDATGLATWWSRSRDELWTKGKTSGNTLAVVEVLIDCDGDTLIYKVRATGPACHTGRRTCFFRKDVGGTWRDVDE